MYQLMKEEMIRIAPLFDGWEETPLWSCLQGYMGQAWTDDRDNPTAAQIVIGDLCFFAGTPNAELTFNIPISFQSEYIIMVPQNNAWENLIEQTYNDNYQRVMRYAIKKESDVFDPVKLSNYMRLIPSEYEIKQIDEAVYYQVVQESWSKDLCQQFPTYKDFEQCGLGYVVLYQNQVVCGASSYTVYDKGIEIEIDTKEEFRRKGLALACASALILECLRRGLYPSWDAANLESVALSEKLGYHFEKEYTAYYVKVNKV